MKTPEEWALKFTPKLFSKPTLETPPDCWVVHWDIATVKQIVEEIQEEAWEDGYNTAKKDVIEFEDVD